MTERPHVVAIVGNDIETDTRVRRMAATAAAAGYRSTVVCYTASGSRTETSLGEVRVIRVPVPFTAQRSLGRVPGLLRPFAGSELGYRHAGPRRRQLAQKRRIEGAVMTHGTISGRLRLLLVRSILYLRHNLFRLRRKGHVEWDRTKSRWHFARTKSSLALRKRWMDPALNLLDYEIEFGPEIEKLKPDIIHAHDHQMIGVAVTAARRLRAQGTPTRVVYDTHELIEGLSYPEGTLRRWIAEESEYIREVDAVLGVSPQQLREVQRRHRLESEPITILNTPVVRDVATPPRTIRDHVGPGPLAVYHGNIAPQRGVATLVQALALLPDLKVAVIAPANPTARQELLDIAEADRTSERLYILDYVPAEQLPLYLASADVAVMPFLPTRNHHVALPNKLFEAIQAGLPIVSSNVEALSEFLGKHGIGETYTSGSVDELAQAISKVLDNRERYAITDALREATTWDTQAARLVSVYRGLAPTDGTATPTLRASDTQLASPVTGDLELDDRSRGLAVGPRNMAGQAFQIARAVESHLGIPSLSISVDRNSYAFPVHIQVSPDQWTDPDWQLSQRQFLASNFSHILAESGTGILGSAAGGFIDTQIPILEHDGLQVALVLHGSEIRDPRRHKRLPFSPYAVDDELTLRLEKATAKLRQHLDRVEVPMFVTTPDLLADVEGASWLPVVIEAREWESIEPPPAGSRPTVLHLPSRGRLKGTEYVEPALQHLQQEGLISVLRPEAVPARAVARLVGQADIVIDGIVLGAYGVMSCQAMAAGRVAVANIRDLGELREECPIVHADPETLEQALRDLLHDRSSWPDRAKLGQEFVRRYHDGAFTAERLRPFLESR